MIKCFLFLRKGTLRARSSKLEWLINYPLAFEVTYSICKQGETTANRISSHLDRTLSTITDTIRALKDSGHNIIEDKGPDPADKRRRLYSIHDDFDCQLLTSDEIVSEYAKASSKLKKNPTILMNIFQSNLVKQLEEYEPNAVWFTDPLNDPSLVLKTRNGLVYLDILRIRNDEPKIIHESFGRALYFKNNGDEKRGIIELYLFDNNVNQSNEPIIEKIIDSLSDATTWVKACIEYRDDESLVNSYIVNKIANSIKSIIIGYI